MPRIVRIFEHKDVFPYLEDRGLVKQYLKAKQYLLNGNTLQVKFKEKNPKGNNVWSFRVNQQFRALGYFEVSGDLKIVRIDNHQN